MSQVEELRWNEDNRGRYLVDPRWQSVLTHGFFGADFDAKSAQETWLSQMGQPRFDRPMQMLQQVHGVAVSSASDPAGSEADAWLIDLREQANTSKLYGILTADCTPVLAYCPRTRVSGAAHCGWRSAVAGLLPIVLKQMTLKGAVLPELQISIGPSAQSCCYEIGKDVWQEVEKCCSNAMQHGILRYDAAAEQRYCEISGLVQQQAEEFGVPARNILRTRRCTICDPSFFSFRRQKAQAGRQLSFLGSLHAQ